MRTSSTSRLQCLAVRVAKPAFILLFWLLVWEGLAMAVGSTLILATPRAALMRLFALAQTGVFWGSIGRSFSRIFMGFSMGGAVGVLLACAACRFKAVEVLFVPIVNVINAIPVATFTIIALLAFSSRNLPVFVAFVTVMPIFFHNTQKGVSATDENLLEMAHSFDVPRWRVATHIYMVAAAPFVLSAASVGIGFAFKSGIAAELIGLVPGTIGASLHTARIFLMSADVFAWTIAIVLLSFGMERVMSWGLGRMAMWR